MALAAAGLCVESWFVKSPSTTPARCLLKTWGNLKSITSKEDAANQHITVHITTWNLANIWACTRALSKLSGMWKPLNQKTAGSPFSAHSSKGNKLVSRLGNVKALIQKFVSVSQDLCDIMLANDMIRAMWGWTKAAPAVCLLFHHSPPPLSEYCLYRRTKWSI